MVRLVPGACYLFPNACQPLEKCNALYSLDVYIVAEAGMTKDPTPRECHLWMQLLAWVACEQVIQNHQ